MAKRKAAGSGSSQKRKGYTAVYLPVVGIPKYRVGDDGSVWSFYSGVWVEIFGTRQKPPRLPYVKIGLTLDGKNIKRWVHRLVLEAFRGPCPAGMESRHENGIHWDNRLVNLSWATHLENVSDQRTHGTRGEGERHSGAKLTNIQAIEIRKRRASGERADDLAAEFHVSQSTIYLIAKRKIWRNV